MPLEAASQWDYARANYRRVYVRKEDQAALKARAKAHGVSVVNLITALLSVDDGLLGQKVERLNGE